MDTEELEEKKNPAFKGFHKKDKEVEKKGPPPRLLPSGWAAFLYLYNLR